MKDCCRAIPDTRLVKINLLEQELEKICKGETRVIRLDYLQIEISKETGRDWK